VRDARSVVNQDEQVELPTQLVKLNGGKVIPKDGQTGRPPLISR
jgi:hypothetical protein